MLLLNASQPLKNAKEEEEAEVEKNGWLAV